MIHPDSSPLCLGQTHAVVAAPRAAVRAYLALVSGLGGLTTAVMLMTGSTHTYMRGHAVLQELERRHVADNPRIFEAVVKEWWQPSRVDELPFVLRWTIWERAR